MDIMRRIFVPVGQGAFYIERFPYGVNVVYDCGSVSARSSSFSLQGRVKQAFPSGDEKIDIVFLSHLDTDHINGLEELLRGCKIGKIYLPFLDNSEKCSLLLEKVSEEGRWADGDFGQDSDFIRKMIEDPRSAVHELDQEARVIFVKPKNLDAESFSWEWTEVIGGDGIQAGEEIPLCDRWRYIPFNVEHSNRKREFERYLKEEHINSATDVLKALREGDKDIIKRARTAYKRVRGGINANSMAVFSGPCKGSNAKAMIEGNFAAKKSQCAYFGRIFSAGCLYLGDFEANRRTNWEALIESLSDRDVLFPSEIGCIQIPHHGSYHNFNEVFLDESMIPVISAGYTRDHPSNKVLRDYAERGLFPFVVTHEQSTELVIECWYS